MKKMVSLLAGMMMVMSMSAWAGHWVCPSGTSGPISIGGTNDPCWYQQDGIQYRGTPETTPVADIIKEENSKAENAAAKLEGKDLIEAANVAMLEAAIAQGKLAALNKRIAELYCGSGKKACIK